MRGEKTVYKKAKTIKSGEKTRMNAPLICHSFDHFVTSLLISLISNGNVPLPEIVELTRYSAVALLRSTSTAYLKLADQDGPLFMRPREWMTAQTRYVAIESGGWNMVRRRG